MHSQSTRSQGQCRLLKPSPGCFEGFAFAPEIWKHCQNTCRAHAVASEPFSALVPSWLETWSRPVSITPQTCHSLQSAAFETQSVTPCSTVSWRADHAKASAPQQTHAVACCWQAENVSFTPAVPWTEPSALTSQFCLAWAALASLLLQAAALVSCLAADSP